ncbi:hypothetical protein LN461_02770 [Xanthomonas arboricola]|uniref:hypothetical protein n=1 Tax=Xanthomonas arboricola TaxID=56448 RepID=UPI001E3C1A5A|nr:hypothetical protein [Xanthomonas arboricola]MCC8668288.1 hypothetical protein [Xanthomonas arboricola]
MTNPSVVVAAQRLRTVIHMLVQVSSTPYVDETGARYLALRRATITLALDASHAVSLGQHMIGA